MNYSAKGKYEGEMVEGWYKNKFLLLLKIENNKFLNYYTKLNLIQKNHKQKNAKIN